MSRNGTPMYSAQQVCKHIVTIEWPDGRTEFKTWRGSSSRAIKAKAKDTYPGAALQFGTAFWVTL